MLNIYELTSSLDQLKKVVPDGERKKAYDLSERAAIRKRMTMTKRMWKRMTMMTMMSKRRRRRRRRATISIRFEYRGLEHSN